MRSRILYYANGAHVYLTRYRILYYANGAHRRAPHSLTSQSIVVINMIMVNSDECMILSDVF